MPDGQDGILRFLARRGHVLDERTILVDDTSDSRANVLLDQLHNLLSPNVLGPVQADILGFVVRGRVKLAQEVRCKDADFIGVDDAHRASSDANNRRVS